jgi:LuxR family transcriptional activator of bioluminescence operon
MLIPLQPHPAAPPPPVYVPTWLQPLVDPALDEKTLPAVVTKIISRFGFETMVYGTAKTKHRGGDERFFFWTTVPKAWVVEYDRGSYAEIDPRISYGWDSPPPLIWDASIAKDDPKAAYFLDRASRHGIGSGLALYFHEDEYSILLSLNRRERHLGHLERAHIEGITGDALHFGYVFHWVFMRRVIARGASPANQGAPLSARELQCLTYAVHGMSSSEIGLKLGIAERTANFHFSNLISKLGVLNRHEAIAIAVANGLVRVEPLGDAKRSSYFSKRAKQAPRGAGKKGSRS